MVCDTRVTTPPTRSGLPRVIVPRSGAAETGPDRDGRAAQGKATPAAVLAWCAVGLLALTIATDVAIGAAAVNLQLREVRW